MGINGFLLAFAIFIIVSMSIYWGFFEEWTIWTDYTMAWVRSLKLSSNEFLFITFVRFRSNLTFSSTIGIV